MKEKENERDNTEDFTPVISEASNDVQDDSLQQGQNSDTTGFFTDNNVSTPLNEETHISVEVYNCAEIELLTSNINVYEESISCDYVQNENCSTNDTEQCNDKEACSPVTTATQTDSASRYSIEQFNNNSESLLHFTGLENYDKFMTVLYSLGPAVYYLKYARGHVGNISVPNQLFLVLWKLRRNCCDNELSEHFSIPRIAVGNIFHTWITFMAKQWSLIDIWPSRQLVDYYMPESFKRHYPSTRVIIDGTEIRVDKSHNPRLQQSSFSTYKNGPTVKTVIGSTPGGLISYHSPAYGGSTSDRQIIERSDLMKKCDSGDLVLADRGFVVQDIFAPHNITVATPTFTKGKGYLPHKTVMKDRLLSKHRVHIERTIGLLKTYKILSSKLNHNYIPLATEIVGVCVMLCNFKENIMRKV